ncbi:hypothetical protein F2P79_003842 [Pimephales promelas]|nr:hypothetical protein F2P79_003842 [Pimephales promelas]
MRFYHTKRFFFPHQSLRSRNRRSLYYAERAGLGRPLKLLGLCETYHPRRRFRAVSSLANKTQAFEDWVQSARSLSLERSPVNYPLLTRVKFFFLFTV